MMTPKALKALRGSIRKWEKIVKGEMGSAGTANCPLCIAFNDDDGHCKGCPVREFTKKDGCENTPYDAWIELEYGSDRLMKDEMYEYPVSPLAFAIARSEVSFLKALLPKKR